MNSFFGIISKSNLSLGINERNLLYMNVYNSKEAIRIADNKLLTKKILSEHNIPTPKLITSFGTYKSLDKFNFSNLPRSFVLKPSRGTEGGGIEIFYNKDSDGNFIKATGERFTLKDLYLHCKRILDGEFSISNKSDKVIIEERIKLTKEFRAYAYKGTPDIRIIVFNKIPIMSYIRIPTQESDGKANLALGAIGCGIDIARGITTSAVYGKTQIISKFPNSNLPVSGIKIPYWNTILRRSIEASIASGLGFCAIDFLIDKEIGPVIVELNARPGLSIQIANQDSLKWRLRKAKGIKIGKNFEKGIRIAKDLFGGEIQEEIEDISGKIVVGLNNKITFTTLPNIVDLDCTIDTSKLVSTIPLSLYDQIIKSNPEIESNNSKILTLEFTINDSNSPIHSKFSVSTKSNTVVLGQNSLTKFLIDLSL